MTPSRGRRLVLKLERLHQLQQVEQNFLNVNLMVRRKKLTSSSALFSLSTANALTRRSENPGPSSSRASSMPTSWPHSGRSFSVACLASSASDQVTHFKNLVKERGERKREKRNFHRRSLSLAESDAVGGRVKISLSRSRSEGPGFRSRPSSPRRWLRNNLRCLISTGFSRQESGSYSVQRFRSFVSVFDGTEVAC